MYFVFQYFLDIIYIIYLYKVPATIFGKVVRCRQPIPRYILAFGIFAALNVNVRNFGVQMDIAKRKEQNGALAFLTQPILSPEGLENLKIAREKLQGRILGGIMPVVSERNARFMNSEIAGITVDEKIIELYRGADREKGESLAVKISTEIAGQMAPYVDGFYIITPFGRTGLVGRIMENIRQAGLA